MSLWQQSKHKTKPKDCQVMHSLVTLKEKKRQSLHKDDDVNSKAHLSAWI
jgi:hypothetical protein